MRIGPFRLGVFDIAILFVGRLVDSVSVQPVAKSSSLPAVVTVLFLITFVLIPSFSTLFALAFLPPRNLRSPWRIATNVLIALYVVLALALVYSKHVRYMADYR